MKPMNNTLEKVTKELLVEPLLEMMTEHMEDFAEESRKYQAALRTIEYYLGEEAEALEKAIYRQTASMILFSGWLGVKVNLDHFTDPVARTFLEVDAETYLQEHIVRCFPETKSAQEVIQRALSHLPAEREEREEIVAYISHLETVVPKLAHYYGYLLGNDLLPHIIPGYCEDARLTLGYMKMMRDYFGKTMIPYEPFKKTVFPKENAHVAQTI